MMLPDYQHVSRPEVRASFEQAWKLAPGTLDAEVGLTVVEVMHAIKKGGIKGMYVQGENPAMSDPDANHARESLAALEHLVVQDIFLTETAYLADVILPARATAATTVVAPMPSVSIQSVPITATRPKKTKTVSSPKGV